MTHKLPNMGGRLGPRPPLSIRDVAKGSKGRCVQNSNTKKIKNSSYSKPLWLAQCSINFGERLIRQQQASKRPRSVRRLVWRTGWSSFEWGRIWCSLLRRRRWKTSLMKQNTSSGFLETTAPILVSDDGQLT